MKETNLRGNGKNQAPLRLEKKKARDRPGLPKRTLNYRKRSKRAVASRLRPMESTSTSLGKMGHGKRESLRRHSRRKDQN